MKKKKKQYPYQITIRVYHPYSGWMDYQRINVSTLVEATTRMYDLIHAHFKTFEHVDKIEGLVERISDRHLYEKEEAKREDYV